MIVDRPLLKSTLFTSEFTWISKIQCCCLDFIEFNTFHFSVLDKHRSIPNHTFQQSFRLFFSVYFERNVKIALINTDQPEVPKWWIGDIFNISEKCQCIDAVRLNRQHNFQNFELIFQKAKIKSDSVVRHQAERGLQSFQKQQYWLGCKFIKLD